MIDYVTLIRDYMRANNKNQTEMAAILKVARPTLTSWLLGTKQMGLKHYLQCAAFFGDK